MGLIVKQTKIMELQNEIASIEHSAQMAIRMYFGKDAMLKESGARQCAMLKDQLLRTAAKLRQLNQRAYIQLKSSIEEMYKRLKVCVVSSVDKLNDKITILGTERTA